MNPGTRVDWVNFLRKVCASHLLQHPKKIGGPNMTVEVDERYFHGEKIIHSNALA